MSCVAQTLQWQSYHFPQKPRDQSPESSSQDQKDQPPGRTAWNQRRNSSLSKVTWHHTLSCLGITSTWRMSTCKIEWPKRDGAGAKPLVEDLNKCGILIHLVQLKTPDIGFFQQRIPLAFYVLKSVWHLVSTIAVCNTCFAILFTIHVHVLYMYCIHIHIILYIYIHACVYIYMYIYI